MISLKEIYDFLTLEPPLGNPWFSLRKIFVFEGREGAPAPTSPSPKSADPGRGLGVRGF